MNEQQDNMNNLRAELDRKYYRIQDHWQISHEVERPASEDILGSIDEAFKAVDWAETEYTKARYGPDTEMRARFYDIQKRLIDQLRYVVKRYDQSHR